MKITEVLGKKILYYDGATGTYLQSLGIETGRVPEILNIEKPEVLTSTHRNYLEAGANIILAHTFGANGLKVKETGYSVDQVISAGVKNAKKAIDLHEKERGEGDYFVSLDIGSLGRLLKPFGDLDFEEAYGLFQEMVQAGVKAGADLITIETMTDIYEMKTAVLAAKEDSSLPVFATCVIEEDGRMLTGADIETMVNVLEGLGVDALGINCSLGPKQMKPLLQDLLSHSSTPLIISPNAGLPRVKEGRTIYNLGAEEYSDFMEEFASLGVGILGGCCGTNPDYIRAMVEKTREIEVRPIEKKRQTKVSSYSRTLSLGKVPLLIGERINPSGNLLLKESLREGKMDVLLQLAMEQEEDGAHMLDINSGVPGLIEEDLLPRIIEEVQAISPLPLQVDTANVSAMERACRIYNGRPLMNSVSGKEESLRKVLPLAKKYGGVLVALCLDDRGIPATAQARVEVAQKILKEGKKYSLGPESFLFDPLALTLSSQEDSALICLETIRELNRLGLYTSIGLSNISFGLPYRDLMNANFLAMALGAGLTCAIVNPSSQELMESYSASLALLGHDKNGVDYVESFQNRGKKKRLEPRQEEKEKDEKDLFHAIEKGLKEEARDLAQEELEKSQPLEIIDEYLIPALNSVGQKFEDKEIFLPQLLMSAEAASCVFSLLKTHLVKEGKTSKPKGRVLVATVKGDIHDIGKNMVKILLENYGFEVLDLGKDVPPERILQTVVDEEIEFVGLSALMTTTLVYMEKTIQLLRKNCPQVKIVVGGAVLTQEYSKEIKAHYYGKDAMETVRAAQKFFMT